MDNQLSVEALKRAERPPPSRTRKEAVCLVVPESLPTPRTFPSLYRRHMLQWRRFRRYTTIPIQHVRTVPSRRRRDLRGIEALKRWSVEALER